MDRTCRHCGGPIEIRNPRGDCDHLYWPDMLTDEAKLENGYVRVIVQTWKRMSTGEPLGAAFERVWDDNARTLYED